MCLFRLFLDCRPLDGELTCQPTSRSVHLERNIYHPFSTRCGRQDKHSTGEPCRSSQQPCEVTYGSPHHTGEEAGGGSPLKTSQEGAQAQQPRAAAHRLGPRAAGLQLCESGRSRDPCPPSRTATGDNFSCASSWGKCFSLVIC